MDPLLALAVAGALLFIAAIPFCAFMAWREARAADARWRAESNRAAASGGRAGGGEKHRGGLGRARSHSLSDKR